MTIEDIPNAYDAGFATGEDEDVIIKVLGVGGGGNNAVSHMFRQDIKHVSFVVLNTDRKALMQSPVPTKVQIGNGLGAGNKPDVARAAAEESAEKIAEIFNDKTKMVFITAGMGGGTGTGASPVVARIARDRGLLTIGIVTIPFLFEGTKKIIKALEGAEEMSKYVDAMLIINNQRLNEIYPDLNVINAFGKADDTLTTAARSIAELITWEDVHIRLDFNDVDTTLRNGGAAIISTGYGEGENRVTKSHTGRSQLSAAQEPRRALVEKLLFNIYINPDMDFKMEGDRRAHIVYQLDRHRCRHHLGYVLRPHSRKPREDDHPRHRIRDYDQRHQDNTRSTFFGGKKDKIDFGENKNSADATERIRQEYGDKAVAGMVEQKTKAKFIVLTPSQMDDDRFIEAFEKSPTHNRNANTANEIREIGRKGSNPGSVAAAVLSRNNDSPLSSGPAPMSSQPGTSNRTIRF